MTSATLLTAASLWSDTTAALTTVGTRALWIAAIVAACIAAGWILRLLIRRIVRRVVAGAKSKARVDDTQALERSPLAAVRVVQRTRTLGTILQNIVTVGLVVIGTLLIVQLVAPDILGSLTLLTAALGAGLGFGAQNYVKDVLNGIFIVAEDQIGIGDVVDLGMATGIVEYVSVRVTHVRDVNGTLWYVRNGEIARIGNMSQGWSRSVVDVTLPANADIAVAEDALLAAATGLASDPRWRSRVIDAPEVWGLESVEGETLVIRVVIKTRAAARDDVARELRVRLRGAAADAGFDVSGLHSTLLTGTDGAHRVRGAQPPRTKPTPIADPPEGRLTSGHRWRARLGTTTNTGEIEVTR